MLLTVTTLAKFNGQRKRKDKKRRKDRKRKERKTKARRGKEKKEVEQSLSNRIWPKKFATGFERRAAQSEQERKQKKQKEVA